MICYYSFQYMLCIDWEVSKLFLANSKHCNDGESQCLHINIAILCTNYTPFLEKPHVSLLMIYPIKNPVGIQYSNWHCHNKNGGLMAIFWTFLQGTSRLGTALGPRRSRDFGGPRQGQDGAGALGGTGGWQGQAPWRHPLGGWGWGLISCPLVI